jgi:glycosyltransferase involved in cell wall biosynthesis
MKASFVATVLNEEDAIDDFVRSLLHQSKKPDEIIIVDGGSTDKTVEKLKQHKKVTLLIKRGNRSIGRNYGISHAGGDVILISDVGCVLDREWSKNITSPFNNQNIDVVSGYYKPVTNSIFEKALAAYTCVMPDKVDPENFLPSSRSVAFKKSAWRKVEGYPEHLDTCEDLVFARNMKRAGLRFSFIKNAIVYWPQRKNISEAFRQFYNYAKGDGMARYFRPSTPLLFFRYAFALLLVYLAIWYNPNWWFVLLALGIFYILWAIRKNYKYVRDRKAFFYLPLLQFTSDVAVLSGTGIGFVTGLRKHS